MFRQPKSFRVKIIHGVGSVYHPGIGFIWCGCLEGIGHTQMCTCIHIKKIVSLTQSEKEM